MPSDARMERVCTTRTPLARSIGASSFTPRSRSTSRPSTALLPLLLIVRRGAWRCRCLRFAWMESSPSLVVMSRPPRQSAGAMGAALRALLIVFPSSSLGRLPSIFFSSSSDPYCSQAPLPAPVLTRSHERSSRPRTDRHSSRSAATASCARALRSAALLAGITLRAEFQRQERAPAREGHSCYGHPVLRIMDDKKTLVSALAHCSPVYRVL